MRLWSDNKTGALGPRWTILELTTEQKTVTIRIHDKAAALKYIEASDAYLLDPGHRKSMVYHEWPDIRKSCPLCKSPGCAVYRGYYSRLLFCTELEFLGLLAIRTGYCKSTQTRFSLTPDFVLAHRRISRLTTLRLQEARGNQLNILAAIDDLTCDLGEEFFLPISTAHSYLQLRIQHPP